MRSDRTYLEAATTTGCGLPTEDGLCRAVASTTSLARGFSADSASPWGFMTSAERRRLSWPWMRRRRSAYGLHRFGCASWARSHLQSHLIDLARDGQLRRYVFLGSFATEDGGLIFQSWSPLVKIDACSRLVWVNDEDLFHHSIERDDNGMFWVPTEQEPVTIKVRNPEKFRDDSIAMVSPDGKLLMNRSVSQILIDNGLGHLVFRGDGSFPDPIHVNDIEPVRKDGPYWRKGDLFLSLRSTSTVMLYRPSTNKVIWHKIGPWSGQHDVDILDDHRISIFNNNGREKYVAFRTAEVNIYDFATDEVTSPWRAALERLHVWAPIESLAEVLPNDELFVEEQPHGRLIRLTLDGDVVWEYVNRAKMGRVFKMTWSRFLDTATGSRLAETLARVDCARTADRREGPGAGERCCACDDWNPFGVGLCFGCAMRLD